MLYSLAILLLTDLISPSSQAAGRTERQGRQLPLIECLRNASVAVVTPADSELYETERVVLNKAVSDSTGGLGLQLLCLQPQRDCVCALGPTPMKATAPVVDCWSTLRGSVNSRWSSETTRRLM
mmetsp:Transcript_30412/g.88388  ORF Transcript_30412/g.88388 Transcript_30412/m.88388 type:complete len:124 (+) Transcript_30412:8-379(+)